MEDSKGYIVRWKYSDGSVDEGIRLFPSRDSAVDLLNILRSVGDDSKIYYIEDFPKKKNA